MLKRKWRKKRVLASVNIRYAIERELPGNSNAESLCLVGLSCRSIESVESVM